MFDILGAGDGTQLGVASENDVLEARKEAIPNSIEPGYRPRFARKKTSVAQPHILCQVCGVYVSYECEAGLESLHIGVEIAFSGPASHSMSSLWCVHVI